MPRIKKVVKPTSTAQSLGSLITTCRKIMRKDKGLSTDLDRLPMLTWILFLKFLDDLEQVREAEASMEGKRYRSTIAEPYRWRDWAAKPDGITGDALLAFINQQDDVALPNGKKGPGLFAYLRSLTGSNGGDRRDVIRAVFEGTVNRMLNGYLLRDVLNKVNGIHFTSTDEIYTLGHLYESMLKEMRDAAGENGEFYTPRALVKFIVTAINPRLGETVLDPASGTGGFLAQAFEHMKKQCKTAEEHRRLQRDTLYGCEAKPLPFLLCQMNLLLHGVETPNIDPLNALRFPLREIGDKDRVDVIITNPPFGGEEERGILGNFPEDKKTAETAMLFLQLIMRKLRRLPKAGRAAVVVPNGTLFGDGICARIKEEMLKDFNLHTIVRLPKGVFSPYTQIETNILFFDRSEPTTNVWYYDHPLPKGRKNYTKTQPIQFEEFAPLVSWWRKREENEHAWKWDFRKDYDEAISAATTHWKFAQEERVRAGKLSQEGKNLSSEIEQLKKSQSGKSGKIISPQLESLEKQLIELVATMRKVEQTAKEEQAAGDGIYWPIYNLDRKNPQSKEDFNHRKPEQLADDIIGKCENIASLMSAIKVRPKLEGSIRQWPLVNLAQVLEHRKEFITIDDTHTYRRPRVQLHAQGIVIRDEVPGALIKTKKQQVCKSGEFLVAEIDAKVGGFGIVPDLLDGCIVSSHYFLFVINEGLLDRRFLNYFIRTPTFRDQVEAQGSTNYAAIRPSHVLGYKMPLPPIDEQHRVVLLMESVDKAKGLLSEMADELGAVLPAVFHSALKGEF